jgi:hypothetical protein
LKKPISTTAFLAKKRLKKRLHRAQVLADRERRNRDPLDVRVKYDPTSLIGWLSKALSIKDVARGAQLSISIPKDFSVIKSPDEVVKALARLVTITKRPEVRSIMFDHSRMETYDLAAEQAIDTIASDIHLTTRIAGRQMRLMGRYPSSSDGRRFLRSIGIIKYLKVSHEFLTEEEQSDLEIYVAHRRQGSEDVVFGRSDRKSEETRRFVDHINKCLARNGRRLSGEGIEKLSMYTGEVLANAEEHSQRGEWLLAGYLDNAAEGHFCEIAVLSFGKTIAATFRELDLDSYPMRQVGPYVVAHGERGFFSQGWGPDDLLTLVALQGGISCRNESDEMTRGQGTIDLITFFEKMHEECQGKDVKGCQMAIFSGHTHILFDGTHKLKRDSTGRDVIAFNKLNSLEDPPDDNYVRHVESAFPGTAISIRFPLQSAYTTVRERAGEPT